jgi:hypothetical protein
VEFPIGSRNVPKIVGGILKTAGLDTSTVITVLRFKFEDFTCDGDCALASDAEHSTDKLNRKKIPFLMPFSFAARRVPQEET